MQDALQKYRIKYIQVADGVDGKRFTPEDLFRRFRDIRQLTPTILELHMTATQEEMVSEIDWAIHKKRSSRIAARSLGWSV